MTPHLPALPRRRWAPPVALLLLAVAAMGGTLRDGWVQDDAPLIAGNPSVQSVSGLWSGFTEPYWPPPSPGGLYRPLARSAHTALWALGDGALWPFRVADLLLYAGLVLAVWGLAREFLPATPAWVAAALFAVHPVHVEAVAVAVNQGECVVGIAACVAAIAWRRWRSGRLRTAPALGGVAAALLVGLGFKETALVLPLLLALVELIDPAPAVPSRRRRWLALAALAALGAGWWALRAHVLGGFAGAAPAEGLRDASAVARALTMLGVAGEWARLLLWPARLQGDYAPWEIAPWSQWSAEQTAGLLVVGATALALALAWRRAPVVAFAIGWVVVALAPVSNLVVPTGILLAERTLLLPSIGVVLAVAAAVPAAAWHAARWRPALYGGVTVLGLLGLVRSRARVPVFRDRDAYLSSMMRDAPRSWRTMVAAGIAATEAGDPVTGRRLLLAANATWPDSPRPLAVLAFYDRLQGRCDAAIAPQWQALRLAPKDRWTRLPLVACLLDVGAYAEAGRLAAADTGSDPMGRALAAAAATADSAARAGAPPHSVRLAPVTGGLTLVGTRR